MEKPNPFIQFYGAHNISPVHQDISNLALHLRRRDKLYRTLGIAPSSFNARAIMEVGPGGGYNALAYFHWGANVVFVEPNPKAQEELPSLLAKNHISPQRWTLIRKSIEETPMEISYDIVIAEGIIPGLHERSAFISSLSKRVNDGGVLVVTCADDISILFEHLKRLVAARLITAKRASRFEDKIDLLEQAFASHLANLRHASRPVRDWVTDVFINPATYGKVFSIADCITEFGLEFDVMSCSPNLFTDYSWYKDVTIDRNRSCLEQFSTKCHNLLLWDSQETSRPAESNARLRKAAYDLRMYASSLDENHYSDEAAQKTCSMIEGIIEITRDIDSRVVDILSETIRLLSDISLDAEKVAKADKLARAFGRGQQYVSLVKRMTY